MVLLVFVSYILLMLSPYQVCDLQNFSALLYYLFMLLFLFKSFSDWYSTIFFLPFSQLWESCSKASLAMSISFTFSCVDFYNNFIFSSLISNSLVYFLFLWLRKWSHFILLSVNIQFSQHTCWKDFTFSGMHFHHLYH